MRGTGWSREFVVLPGEKKVMKNTYQLPEAVWDCWRSSHSKPTDIAKHQQARLADLVSYARTHAPFYQQHYHQLPLNASDNHLLPPVTKSELMAHFDEWVTDPAITGVQTSCDRFVRGRFKTVMEQ